MINLALKYIGKGGHMIEVRSSFLVRMSNVKPAIELWKHIRDTVWPLLGWRGRFEQMLHGHMQQSLFVWSSEWDNLPTYEKAMSKALDYKEYLVAQKQIDEMCEYGWENEVFSILEPFIPADNTSGKVEVRSSYIVHVQNIDKAREITRYGQENVWPIVNWSGQNQQALYGKPSQCLFVWSSVWNRLADWEVAMTIPVGRDKFQLYFSEKTKIVEFGGPREVFRIL
jgi:hypothetical protein